MERERERGDYGLNEARAGAMVGSQGRAYENVKTTAPRDSGVQAELDDLRQAVHVHTEMLTQLANRLQPVMLDASPATEGNTRTPDRNVCGVGESIRTIRREIEGLTQGLREITRRVDL